MSKRKGKRKQLATTDAAPLAERHDFDVSGLLGHDSTYTVNVSETIALAVPTVYQCVRIIADLVSDADVQEMRGTEVLPPSRIALRPMATITRRTWLWVMSATMALYNGTWIEYRGGRDSEGVPFSLVPIAPTRVHFIGTTMYVDGQEVNRENFRWVPRTSWPTVTTDIGTVIRLARDVIAAAWAAESYRADFWQTGGAPVLQIVSDQVLSNDQADAMRDRYVLRRTENPGSPAVFGRGAKLEPVGADVASEGAVAAAEKLGSEIAKYFGVPAWLANVPAAAGSLVYQNASSAGLDLVRYTLRPGYAGPIGDAWSDALPGGYLSGRRVNVGLTHLTEGTVLEQAQAYQIATGNKAWMLPSEVRADLNMPMDMTLDEQGTPAPAMEQIPGGINATANP